MESHVREFVHQCLHCVDTRAGEIVPRPYRDTVHGTAPGEVVHFDFLYQGMSAAADLKVVRVCVKRMDFATSW